MSFFDAVSKGQEAIGIESGIQVINGLKILTVEPLIVEEKQDGQSREVVYVGSLWPSSSGEESAKVVITDVDIPCSVAIDDK